MTLGYLNCDKIKQYHNENEWIRDNHFHVYVYVHIYVYIYIYIKETFMVFTDTYDAASTMITSIGSDVKKYEIG